MDYDVSEVVNNAMPSMVSIANNYVEKITYFGQPMEREGEASGSGIIVGENETELLIATNYHVIEDAKKLMVHFVDNTDVEECTAGVARIDGCIGLDKRAGGAVLHLHIPVQRADNAICHGLSVAQRIADGNHGLAQL